VNSLPKTVTRQRRGCDLKPGPSAPESSTLATRLPSHYLCGNKHPLNGPLSGTTRVSRHQKGKTNLDFTEARDSEWQWNPVSALRCRQTTTPAPHHSDFTGRMPFLPPNHHRCCKPVELSSTRSTLTRSVSVRRATPDRHSTGSRAVTSPTKLSQSESGSEQGRQ